MSNAEHGVVYRKQLVIRGTSDNEARLLAYLQECEAAADEVFETYPHVAASSAITDAPFTGNVGEDQQFEAHVAHVVGCAAEWPQGSGSHPPRLIQAIRELRDYFYRRAPADGEKVEPCADQAPIARVRVTEGDFASVTMYAPGLPPGDHDLYCVPFPADMDPLPYREEIRELCEQAMHSHGDYEGSLRAIYGITHRSAPEPAAAADWGRLIALLTAVRNRLLDRGEYDKAGADVVDATTIGEAIAALQSPGEPPGGPDDTFQDAWQRLYSAVSRSIPKGAEGGTCLEMAIAEASRLQAVEAVARELITTGMKNNGEHLIVVEKKDKSDPHYRLCDLLEPRKPRLPLTKDGGA